MLGMGFVKVVSTKELGLGKMVGAEAGGKEILIVNLEGKYHAMGNICTHTGCKLSEGMLKGEGVQCPCRSSVFNVKTGKVVESPAEDPEPTFQVKVEEG